MTPIIFGSITGDCSVINADRINHLIFDGARCVIYYGTQPAHIVEDAGLIAQLRTWVANREYQTRPPTAP